MSLFSTHCMWHLLTKLSDAWYVRETSDPTCGERLAELKDLLNLIHRRWRVAGQYSSTTYTKSWVTPWVCGFYTCICCVSRQSTVVADSFLGEYVTIIEATEFALASAIR